MKCDLSITNEAYKLRGGAAWQEPEPLGRLLAARGETAGFQLVLAPERACGINIGKGPWYGGDQPTPCIRVAVRAPFPVRLYHLGCLPDDDGSPVADILLAQPVVRVQGNERAGVWVDLEVGATAESGTYPVEIRLYLSLDASDEALLCTKTLTLAVHPYTLPSSRAFETYLDLWQHPSNIARQFEVELWSDAHFRVLEACIETLSQLGQKAVTLIVSEIPWRGQHSRDNRRAAANLFEHSMVPISRRTDGTLCFDFSILERYINLCAGYGIDRELSVYGLIRIWRNGHFADRLIAEEYPEALLLRCFEEATGAYTYLTSLSEVRAYIVALEQFFLRTGRIDRVRVAADEPPDLSLYGKSLDFLRQTAPAFQYKAALDHTQFLGPYDDVIQDFAPVLGGALKRHEALQALRAQRPDRVLLWYICCQPPYPNTFLSSDLLEARFFGALTAFLGLDGLLRWAYTCWTEQPRQDIRYLEWRAGDLCLVYPAAHGGILLSLRYKALRRGIEDHELLLRLRRQGRQDVVGRVLDLLMPVTDPAALLDEAGNIRPGLFAGGYEAFTTAREWMLDALAQGAGEKP